MTTRKDQDAIEVKAVARYIEEQSSIEENRYVFAFPPAVPLPSFTNLGDYRVRGLEATWQQQWNTAWSSFAGVTLLDSTLGWLNRCKNTSRVDC